MEKYGKDHDKPSNFFWGAFLDTRKSEMAGCLSCLLVQTGTRSKIMILSPFHHHVDPFVHITITNHKLYFFDDHGKSELPYQTNH